MEFLPLLAGGVSLLSNIFGDDTVTSGRKDSVGSSTQEQTQEQTQRGVQNTTSGETVNQGTDGTVTRLNDATRKNLNRKVNRQLDNSNQIFGKFSQMLTELTQGPRFNAGRFVDDTVSAARQEINNQANQDVAQIREASGGSLGGNSAAALLANRIRQDANAKVAGIRADATLQGATTQGNLDEQLAGITAGLGNSTLQGTNMLLSSLLQAKEGTTQDVNESRTGTSTVLNKNRATATGTVKQRDKGSTTATEKETKGGGWKGFFSGLSDIFSAEF